jgi:hypothetical protein
LVDGLHPSQLNNCSSLLQPSLTEQLSSLNVNPVDPHNKEFIPISLTNLIVVSITLAHVGVGVCVGVGVGVSVTIEQTSNPDISPTIDSNYCKFGCGSPFNAYPE